MNRRGPGLLGTVARTAVVAGDGISGQRTGPAAPAAEVGRSGSGRSGRGRRTAAGRTTADTPAQAAPPAPPADDIIDRLERLAELKKQGILTDAEFEAQKAKVLVEADPAGANPFISRVRSKPCQE